MRLSYLLLAACLLAPTLLPAQRYQRRPRPVRPAAPAQPAAFNAQQRPRNLTDEQLLDAVQRQTFNYFWELGKSNSGMARERSNASFDTGPEVVTTGGTGFGLMAIIVAAERKWITREQAAQRVSQIVNFLWKADLYHGAFPHWLDGRTGRTIRFGLKDDGADIVETSFLFEGLICCRQYFSQSTPDEQNIRNKALWLWENVEWNWFTQGQNVLYWHWSPNNGWAMNHQIHGWNECLITYVLAAGSPRFAIDKAVYDKGWATGPEYKNDNSYYGFTLPLGPKLGGPLFFSHYSFMGLDPHGLKDRYADYWTQNKNHTLINRTYCVENPKHYPDYGTNCWGLTASDSYEGYAAHSPTEDLGVISPTAALSAMPYTPDYSMQALRHFYDDLGDKLWSPYGFYDAFSEAHHWVASSHLAIDQGPIVAMIENHRSGLLWTLFMNSPEAQRGLKKLGFESPYLNAAK